MKRYKAMIFDFDMTLADTAQVIVTLLNKTARDFGYPEMAFEDALPIVGNTHEIMLAHVTRERDPQRIAEMRTYYRQLCRDRMPDMTEFFPDVPDCLAQIARGGTAIGVLSLKLRDVLMASLVKYGLDKYFDVVIGCEEVAAPKPDPSGLFSTMEAMGVAPDETLYIGDSLVDQEAARGAGVDFAAMLRGGTSREQFDPGLVKYFYSTAAQLAQDMASLSASGKLAGMETE